MSFSAGQMEDEHNTLNESPISTNNQKANGLLSRLIGDAYNQEILVTSIKTRTLINCCSLITCISEEFHNKSLNPFPELHSISESIPIVLMGLFYFSITLLIEAL